MNNEKKPNTEFFAVVEVMGHNVYAGLVSDFTLGGAAFIRVDVPEIPERVEKRRTWDYDKNEYVPQDAVIAGAPAYTKIIGTGSIYAITPCTEEVARRVADQRRQNPVNVIDLVSPKALAAAVAEDDDDEDAVPC